MGKLGTAHNPHAPPSSSIPAECFIGDFDDDVQAERQTRGSTPPTMLSLMNPLTGKTTNTIAHEGPLVMAIIAIVLVGNLVFRVNHPDKYFRAAGIRFHVHVWKCCPHFISRTWL
jgi:hypothetical protein